MSAINLRPIETASRATEHNPTWVVQRAWSTFRLPRLQELIRIIIVDLQSLPTSDLLEHESKRAGHAGCDPIAEALRACCEELREASGMTGADDARAEHCSLVRSYMQQEPAAWSEAFTEALGNYRKAASRSLESIFTRSAVV